MFIVIYRLFIYLFHSLCTTLYTLILNSFDLLHFCSTISSECIYYGLSNRACCCSTSVVSLKFQPIRPSSWDFPMPQSLSSLPHMALFCNIPFPCQHSSRIRNKVRMTRSGQRVQRHKVWEPALDWHSQEHQRPCLALRRAALFLQSDKDVPFPSMPCYTTSPTLPFTQATVQKHLSFNAL